MSPITQGRRADEARRLIHVNQSAEAESLAVHWPVSFLRQVIHPDVTMAEARLVRVSAVPSVCYRLALAYDDGRPTTDDRRPTTADGRPPFANGHLSAVSGQSSVVGNGRPSSVIVKRIAPLWKEDEEGHRREYSFYQEVMPELGLPSPHVYYTGAEPDSDYNLVILQDLAITHDFPSPRYKWTEREFRLMLRAYAGLHTRGQEWLRVRGNTPSWFYPRYEAQVIAQAEALPSMAEVMVAQGFWRPLPNLTRLVTYTLQEIERLAAVPATILHNDPYPPNVGLPRDAVPRTSRFAPEPGGCEPGGSEYSEAVPIDWDMVGSGLAEMDLAYLFMQPYRSAADINRPAAETFYWQERERLGGVIPVAAERRFCQHHADTILALRQLPVAARMALAPYPAGSAPYNYWQEMFTVLEERLQALCERLEIGDWRLGD